MVGICAEVVVRNEALFLRESLLSIAGAFEEIIVVDHDSVDETPNIIEDLKPLLPEMRVYRTKGEVSYANCRNLIAERTRCDWLCKWDADFVAYENNTPRGLDALRPRIDKLSSRGVNLILLHAPNCGPTLATTIRGKEMAGINGDIKVVRREVAKYKTGSYADEYCADIGALKRAHLNRDDEPAYMVHLDRLKLPERLIIRNLMFTHDKERFSGQTHLSFDQWLRQRGGSIDSRISRALNRMVSEIISFDFKRWGPHPKILTGAIGKAPMKVQGLFQWKRLTECGADKEFPALRAWLKERLA